MLEPFPKPNITFSMFRTTKYAYLVFVLTLGEEE